MQPQNPDTTPDEVLIHQARDALIYLDLMKDRPSRVELRGVITKVRNHGGVIFYTFEDATASLQLLALRTQFSQTDWSQMRHLKPSDRVLAKGTIGKSNTGAPTVYLDASLQLLDSAGPASETTVRDLDRVDVRLRVGVRLFLARLRYKAEAFFRSQGFLQIEPNFISTSWEISGIEPLRVEYEGFGAAAYLTPSPSPQILAAMEATGWDKVFAVGRCFTTTYRDKTTSAESLILMAKFAHATIDDLANISEQALSATLGDRETMPENYLNFMSSGWRRAFPEESPTPGGLAVAIPTIQTYQLPIKGPDQSASGMPNAVSILRVCWPPRHVLIEGSLRKLSGQRGDATLTLFLERMVPLLKDVPLRQIRDLQRAGA